MEFKDLDLAIVVERVFAGGELERREALLHGGKHARTRRARYRTSGGSLRSDSGALSRAGTLPLDGFTQPGTGRAAGGRELNLGARQGEIFNAVNSVFVNGYLTTAGWAYDRTRELIERAAFEVEPQTDAMTDR
jgi:hypothetical protein